MKQKDRPMVGSEKERGFDGAPDTEWWRSLKYVLMAHKERVLQEGTRAG